MASTPVGDYGHVRLAAGFTVNDQCAAYSVCCCLLQSQQRVGHRRLHGSAGFCFDITITSHKESLSLILRFNNNIAGLTI
jgi:hypothetical protein